MPRNNNTAAHTASVRKARNPVSHRLAVLLGVGLSISALPHSVRAGTILIAKSAALSDGLVVRDALKDECNPQTEVPTRIGAALEQRGHRVAFVDSVPTADSDLSVAVEITSLYAPGGGGWNWGGYGKLGLKQISTRTTLYANQEAVASVSRASQYKGGPLKYMRTTCGILMQAVDKLAADTVNALSVEMSNVRFRRGDDLKSTEKEKAEPEGN